MADFIGHGATFKRYSGSAWANLAGITAMQPPQPSRDTVETTDFASTDMYRTFIGGLRDSGEATFTMKFDKTQLETIQSDLDSDTIGQYAIQFDDSDTTAISWSGWVTAVAPTSPLDDVVTADVTIKVSGKVVIDTGSAIS